MIDRRFTNHVFARLALNEALIRFLASCARLSRFDASIVVVVLNARRKIIARSPHLYQLDGSHSYDPRNPLIGVLRSSRIPPRSNRSSMQIISFHLVPGVLAL